MTEGWVQYLITAGVGFIVWELRQLRRDLSYKVHYRECDQRMAALEKQIESLKERMD